MELSDFSGAMGSAVSGIFNLFSNRQNNKAKERLAAQQNQWNIEQWQREADFTREMWNANNEYNDPSAQMERLEAAGLSPWAASDAVTGGESSAVSTPAGSPAVGYEPTAMNFDFIGEATSRAFEQYMRQREFELQATKQAKENAILDEQLAQQKIKTAVDSEFGLSVGRAQLDNLLLDQHNKKYNAALSMQALENNAGMFQLQQDYQRRQNTLMERTIRKQELDNYALDIANKAAELNLKNLPKQIAANLALTFAQIDAQQAAGELSRESAKNQKAMSVLVETQNSGLKVSQQDAHDLAEIQKQSAENDKYGRYVGLGRGIGQYFLDRIRDWMYKTSRTEHWSDARKRRRKALESAPWYSPVFYGY